MATFRNRHSYAVFLAWILSCLMCITSLCHAQLTELKPGGVLRYWDTLVSTRGVCTLGFFNRGIDTEAWYMGIWYTNQNYHKVWVANRNNSLPNTNAYLTLDDNGIFKILDGDHNSTQIPLNLPDHAAKNSRAHLTNTCNLVLEELNDDGTTKQVLWQSFDNPVDNLLPGMKLGINFTTGETWSLQSWTSSQIASPGTYSLEWDWRNTQLVMKFRGEVYWTSGSIDPQNKTFPYFQESVYKFFIDYVFNYVSNEKDSSYVYYTVTSKRLAWLYLNIDGGIDDNTNNPFYVPDEACYGYFGALGCIEQVSNKCRVGKNNKVDQFFQRSAIVFRNSVTWINDSLSIGISDCWATCWNNCSCIAYMSNTNNGTGCVFYDVGSTLDTIEYESGRDVFILGSVLDKRNSGSKWWIWIVVSLVAALVIVLLAWLLYIRRRKLKEAKERFQEEILVDLTTSKRFTDSTDIGDDGNKGREVKLFSFASILAATNNFSSENKLGQGGFGPVYKGTLSDGRKIAVKRLSRGSGQGLVEFKNEIVLIAKLQHTNLVRLFGCCIQGDDEKMLIYEYMPNKSLDFFIFDPKKKEVLDWQKRYNIIEGIAQGLLYLHKYSRFKVIHRDMKVSNILLDDEMNPKISDFGLAKIFGKNVKEETTNRVVGTYGYMSPEYAMEGIFSEKSDVYSYGVLVLEIISGRKNSSFSQYDCPMSIVSYAWQLWRDGRIMELVDSSLSDLYRSQIFRCIQVCLLCVQDKVFDRPTMSDVIAMLNNEAFPLPAPKEPPSSNQTMVIEEDADNNGNNIYSQNKVTITALDPR